METLFEENVPNVTKLQPKQKYLTIFARFDELVEGEILTILYDHDPKPLYYQLLAERGDIFDWKYLEQGPEWWKVCIGKYKTSEAGETLGQLAAKDMRKVRVFKKYGLDFCCGGKKTVKEACIEKGIDVTKVEQELQNVERSPVLRALPCNEWSLDFLCEYIINSHHSYVRKTLPELELYAKKVADVHGKQQPELTTIYQLVLKIASEMTAHMLKEEKVVFPYIVSLENSSDNSGFAREPQLDLINEPIALMEMEHEEVGKHIQEIKALTNNYKLPENACASYKFLYKLLEEFEEDLYMHIHLENNILFVKALQLEKTEK